MDSYSVVQEITLEKALPIVNIHKSFLHPKS